MSSSDATKFEEQPPPYSNYESGGVGQQQPKPFPIANYPPSNYPPPAATGPYPTYGFSQIPQQQPVGGVPMMQASPNVTQVVVTAPFQLSADPVSTRCPGCQQMITTTVTAVPGCMTWLICIMIAFFGGIFGCCLIPFFIDSLQDVEHRCPNCDRVIGTYRRQTNYGYGYGYGRYGGGYGGSYAPTTTVVTIQQPPPQPLYR